MDSIWVTAGDGAWCHSLNIIWWAKGSNPFNMIISASHKVHKITTTTSSSQSTHHSADCASVGSFRATGPWDISRLWEVHCHGIGCFSLKPRDTVAHLDFSRQFFMTFPTTPKKKHDNNQDMKTCTGKQTKKQHITRAWALAAICCWRSWFTFNNRSMSLRSLALQGQVGRISVSSVKANW